MYGVDEKGQIGVKGGQESALGGFLQNGRSTVRVKVGEGWKSRREVQYVRWVVEKRGQNPIEPSPSNTAQCHQPCIALYYARKTYPLEP